MDNCGHPPEQPTAAGSYELTLVNHGTRDHTLVNDALGVSLRTHEPAGDREATVARTRVDLTAGTYTFSCRSPGHRGSGMEFDLVVGPAEGPTRISTHRAPGRGWAAARLSRA